MELSLPVPQPFPPDDPRFPHGTRGTQAGALIVPDSVTGTPIRLDQAYLLEVFNRVVPTLKPGERIAAGFAATKDGVGVGLVWGKDSDQGIDWHLKAAYIYDRGAGHTAAVAGTISK